MKLLRFPQLVQVLVLQHLGLDGLFMLSLCSQKMRNQIKSTFRAKSTGLSMVLDSLREEGYIYFEGLFACFKVITWVVENPETTPRESSVLFLKFDTDMVSCG